MILTNLMQGNAILGYHLWRDVALSAGDDWHSLLRSHFTASSSNAFFTSFLLRVFELRMLFLAFFLEKRKWRVKKRVFRGVFVLFRPTLCQVSLLQNAPATSNSNSSTLSTTAPHCLPLLPSFGSQSLFSWIFPHRGTVPSQALVVERIV